MLDLRSILVQSYRPFVEEYVELDSELAAVERGDKPISIVELSMSTVLSAAEPYLDFISLALKRGLEVSCSPIVSADGRDQSAAVCAYRQSEGWRVTAYQLLREMQTRYQWSDGSEFVLSRVLGYTDAQTASWMKFRRHRRCSWNGQTVYLVLSDTQRMALDAVGCRCIAPQAFQADLLMFYPTGFNVISEDAYVKAREHHMVIGRVAVTWSFFFGLFGAAESWEGHEVVSVDLRGRDPAEVNAELLTKIEFISGSEWL